MTADAWSVSNDVYQGEISGDSASSSAADGKRENLDDSASSSDVDHYSALPMGIFGCASMLFLGYGLAQFRDKDEHDVGFLAMVERKMEQVADMACSLFAVDDGPLLPDLKLLNYPPNLPTLVIDLDKVVAKFEYDRRKGWQVKKRPYADRFFRELLNYYELVLWSDDSYPIATDVANRWNLPVIGIIHRDQCKKIRGSYVKDLKKLGRDLRRVVMLDHDPKACLLQEGNGILIHEFDGDEDDKELLYMLSLLKAIALNPNDVTVQLEQMGGGLDPELARKFSEKSMQDCERAKIRKTLSKRVGFKHY